MRLENGWFVPEFKLGGVLESPGVSCAVLWWDGKKDGKFGARLDGRAFSFGCWGGVDCCLGTLWFECLSKGHEPFYSRAFGSVENVS